jgi:lysozyme family protein
MTDQFDALIEPLLSAEGGYVDNKADNGGETNFGVTIAVARANGYTGDMHAMTRDQAVAVYRAKYWITPRFDQIAAIDPSIAADLFDCGVNMGTGTAGQLLQHALNALERPTPDYPVLTVDGNVGPNTVYALKTFLGIRGALGATVLKRAFECLRGARYITLTDTHVNDHAFIFGWLANRVAV